MKQFVFVFAAALAFGTVSAQALADDTQAQLQMAYDAQCKAAVAQDADSFAKLFAPNFQSTDADGKTMNLSQIVAMIKAPPAGLTFTSCAFVIRRVTADDGTATALVTQTSVGTLAQGGGAPQPFTQIQESTDTWSLAGSPLQLTSTETGDRVTLAGKVVQEKGTLTTPPARP